MQAHKIMHVSMAPHNERQAESFNACKLPFKFLSLIGAFANISVHKKPLLMLLPRKNIVNYLCSVAHFRLNTI